jgi:DNA-binding CsgD family transcriptional regulator
MMEYSGKKVRVAAIRDVTERKQAETELRKRETELEIQSQHLQEINLALKVLLKQRDKDKKELQKSIVANVKELIAPYLAKLSQGRLDDRQRSYVSLAQTNLNDIISPFIGTLSSKYLKLSPTEIQVASLIKHAKTTKEIAKLLNLSVETIKFHRKNIRRKIGIKSKKANLRTYLISMQDQG